MARKKRVDDGRLNLTLPKKLNRRLNRYILEYANRKGEIPYAIRTKIVRLALQQWLDRNENNFDIQF